MLIRHISYMESHWDEIEGIYLLGLIVTLQVSKKRLFIR
jgi:hypothetical protein